MRRRDFVKVLANLPFVGMWLFRFVRPVAATVQDGQWHDPKTWGGSVPGPEDDVLIRHKVEMIYPVEVGGDLTVGEGAELDVRAPVSAFLHPV